MVALKALYLCTIGISCCEIIWTVQKMSQAAVPKVSFVSLGCPKALVDSERIITRLRAEGYELARKHDGADLVIVNTCGFIDAAVQESLDAIGEALTENGKVIVTGGGGLVWSRASTRR